MLLGAILFIGAFMDKSGTTKYKSHYAGLDDAATAKELFRYFESHTFYDYTVSRDDERIEREVKEALGVAFRRGYQAALEKAKEVMSIWHAKRHGANPDHRSPSDVMTDLMELP